MRGRGQLDDRQFDDAWLSLDEAAERLGVSRLRVREAIAAKAIAARRDNHGFWRVSLSDGAAVSIRRVGECGPTRSSSSNCCLTRSRSSTGAGGSGRRMRRGWLRFSSANRPDRASNGLGRAADRTGPLTRDAGHRTQRAVPSDHRTGARQARGEDPNSCGCRPHGQGSHNHRRPRRRGDAPNRGGAETADAARADLCAGRTEPRARRRGGTRSRMARATARTAAGRRPISVLHTKQAARASGKRRRNPKICVDSHLPLSLMYIRWTSDMDLAHGVGRRSDPRL